NYDRQSGWTSIGSVESRFRIRRAALSYVKRAAYFFKKPENFFWKRDSRPPRSTRCCWPPVQDGCDFGSISRCSVSPDLPQVERVVNSVPSVMTTLMICELGCVSVFMALHSGCFAEIGRLYNAASTVGQAAAIDR